MNELIKQLITLLAGFIFTWLIGKYPDFPLDSEKFINLIIWIFTLMGIISGLRFQWQKLSGYLKQRP